MRYDTVRLILGDQLNNEHSWFQQADDTVLYLIAELKKNTYVTHHIQRCAPSSPRWLCLLKRSKKKGIMFCI